MVGACASESQTQANLGASYYQLPSSDGATARPAIVGGTLEQIRRPAVSEREAIDQFCAYVFSVDGRVVGDRADCTVGIPIMPGKHTIAARLQGDRYSSGGRQTFNPLTATLSFDAEQGHHYKISMDSIDFPRGTARIWITNVTTQTSVTEAGLVTRNGPEGVPRWEPARISNEPF